MSGWRRGAAAVAVLTVALSAPAGAQRASRPAGKGTAPPAASVTPRHAPDRGPALYATTCQPCHQATGQGVPGQFPPLAGSSWVTGPEARVVLIVLHGLTGEVEVDGEPFAGLMPAWGAQLSDADLAAVASYVRRSWGNQAAPVTPATVARLRRAHAARTTPWTAAALEDAVARALSSPRP